MGLCNYRGHRGQRKYRDNRECDNVLLQPALRAVLHHLGLLKRLHDERGMHEPVPGQHDVLDFGKLLDGHLLLHVLRLLVSSERRIARLSKRRSHGVWMRLLRERADAAESRESAARGPALRCVPLGT